jgi:hypothetical protein
MEIAQMTTVSTAAASIFPALTASTTDAEMLGMLKNPEVAIGFALEHLQPWELRAFFRDWKEEAGMTPWLKAWRADQRAGSGDWSAHEPDATE